MVSTTSEFVSTPQRKGVALYAFDPATDAFVTLPLTSTSGARRNYDLAQEFLDAADWIKFGQDAPRTSYTQRQPTNKSPGYSGFKSDKSKSEISLTDTYAALYEHVRDAGARIIGTNEHSFEVVRHHRVVTYTVAHEVGEDADDFHRYIIPWNSITKDMRDTFSINPHTQEVMLWSGSPSNSAVVPLTEWGEFHLNGSIQPRDEEGPVEQEDELDALLRRKKNGEVLSNADFKRMVHLKQKREWEESELYQRTKNNELIQRLAVPHRAIIDNEVVNYDRGILDHPEAWHTHILDYILSMETGDWFTVDDIDEVVRKSGAKMGRSVRTQFMSMTAYLLKLVGEGLIAVRGIEGLDVYTSKRDNRTVPLVSVDSFTVVGTFKPVQGALFDLV